MDLTKRQLHLLIACVDAELENNHQCDTGLVLDETENAANPDTALKKLKQELRSLKTQLTKAHSKAT